MKKMVGGIILLSVAAVTLGVGQTKEPVARQPSRDEQEVRKLEREWLDAYEKRDAAAMERIVADDFTITFPNGGMQNKAQIIAALNAPLKEGQPTYKFYTEDVRSRAYGDTVILIGRVVTESTQGGKTAKEASRYTDTYVKRRGRWQVVASHLSNVPARRE
ncbi:MAG TPA: nuclear transport factor 2 family protein [Pyrinomonadaceae bacterium]|nr:nuclear transport factor 2 family protein [Pyrinomonadaceae bacterium]